MNQAEQVLFALQLLLVLGPLAVYFLGLGLVNSLAHPCLVNARVDFVLLTIAFVPVILTPLVFLLRQGMFLWSAVVFVGVGSIFWVMLPDGRTRWVVYNCSLSQFRRLLARSARRVGCTADVEQERIQLSPGELELHVYAIPWLRNVTFRLDAADSESRLRLIGALHEELAGEALLPSPAGASLVLIGAGLLGVPMWYLLHHMGAIVDVVRQMLFA